MVMSPIHWFGGKSARVKKLLPLIPYHYRYVEVFGGGASLLLGKQPVPVEVYNDLDSGLVNFFRVLRDEAKYARLCKLAALTPYSREEYNYCLDTYQAVDDDVERAYRWFITARNSFGGLFGESWGVNGMDSKRGMAGRVSAYLSAIDRLPEVHHRLMRVVIEHNTWERIVEVYDNSETFMYFDPPYVPGTRREGKYKHEMTLEDHERLVDTLLRIQSKCMLSGYEHDVYKPLDDAGWARRTFDVVCSAAARTKATGIQGRGACLKNQGRMEVVWMNYKPGQVTV